MIKLSACSEKEILLLPVQSRRILFFDTEQGLEAVLHDKYPQAELVRLSRRMVGKWEENKILPLSGNFDCLLLDHLLEQVDMPQLLVDALKQYLTPDGCMIAAFANIRYWRNWQELLAGHWRYDENGVRQTGIRHLFAQPEIVHLAQQARFADLCFDSCQSAAPKEFLHMLEVIGARNEQDDLETEYWIMRASCQRNQTLWLQKSFTPEIRQQLAYLLRRIETGIDIQANACAVWELCAAQQITAEYLLPFIQNAMLHPQLVLQRLASQTGDSSKS